MNSRDVLAVVVSYNGAAKIRRTVEALRGQVGYVHIVDNGSNAESLHVLESLEVESAITVDRLCENRGVGHALNRGVERARKLGCAWLLTMDQDSVVDKSLIEAYRTAVREDPSRVSLAPRIANGSHRKDSVAGVTGYAITSGNLVSVRIFDQIGLYDEGFFIDCIDFDFCLRLRRAGYAVHRVPGALMQHELGDPFTAHPIVRKFYALHPPTRRYYMYRNYMYMAERYLLEFPIFILKLGAGQLILLLLIGLMDPSPGASFRFIARGIRDYLARKDGQYMERT